VRVDVSQVELHEELAHLIRHEGGLVVSLVVYDERADALEAARA